MIGLQKILVVCSATAKSFAFMFNSNKSHCLSLGKLANVDIDPMFFDIQYIASYIGVHLLKGSSDIAPSSCLFKTHIAYDFCYMLHLLIT